MSWVQRRAHIRQMLKRKTMKLTVPCSDDNRKGIYLFILDEASMISRPVLEAIDRCLRDLTELHNIPFGGKTFVLGGDFWQTLPIVP